MLQLAFNNSGVVYVQKLEDLPGTIKQWFKNLAIKTNLSMSKFNTNKWKESKNCNYSNSFANI